MEFKCQYPKIKFYWRAATLIFLKKIYCPCCLHAIMAEWSSHDKAVHGSGSLKHLLAGPLWEKFAHPPLGTQLRSRHTSLPSCEGQVAPKPEKVQSDVRLA